MSSSSQWSAAWSAAAGGVNKLSAMAETAANTAAQVKADAEAKLVATLNADDASAARVSVGGKEGEGGLDFSSMPRKELEELCTKRSEKLKQAVQKIRAQQQEYTRIQRDYDQLQEIVRESGGGAENTQMKVDVKDAREHSAILKQQLISKDAIIAELKIQALGQQQNAEGISCSKGTDAATGDDGCAGLRADLESLQVKLDLAEVEAAGAEAQVKKVISQAQAEHEASLAEFQQRMQHEHQLVLQLQQQLEEAMGESRANAPAKIESHTANNRTLSVAMAGAEIEQLCMEKDKREKETAELNAALTKEKEKFEKLKVKSQDMLGKFKAQTAEKDAKHKRLEGCPYISLPRPLHVPMRLCPSPCLCINLSSSKMCLRAKPEDANVHKQQITSSS